MKRGRAVPLMVLAGFCVFLPPAGLSVLGIPLAPYLQFPPRELYVSHAPFSWPVFWLYCALILLVMAPFVPALLRQREKRASRSGYWPWWGSAGGLLLAAAWCLAWTRFSFFSAFQPHTFFPLWFGYILLMNGLCCFRQGSCPLIERRLQYVLLFAWSAVFWWVFEWLNRFVQNWTYVNAGLFSPFEYFCFATLSFSTVLPAVSATSEFLGTFSILTPFRNWRRLALPRPVSSNAALLAVCCLLFALIGAAPNALFALLWVLPPIVLHLLQRLFRQASIFDALERGNWQCLLQWSLAALMCGFFWELWNYYSFSKWIYHIPYAGRFRLFEMPILGYAGYLPFGIFCGAVTGILLGEQPAEEAENQCR